MYSSKNKNKIVGLEGVKSNEGVFVHKMENGSYFIGAEPSSRHYNGIDPIIVNTTYKKAVDLRDKYIKWSKSEGN